MWRLDAYASAVPGGAPRIYWSLPTMLFVMTKAESIAMPFASFGTWDAEGGSMDWANAVRLFTEAH